MRLQKCRALWLLERIIFLPAAVRTEGERIIPDVDGIKPTDAADTFLFLKANYNQEQST